MPIARNIKFGNQTAISGDIAPLTENEVDKVEKRMYNALSARPIPKLIPIPPLTLRDESDTPIRVMIKAANGIADRKSVV